MSNTGDGREELCMSTHTCPHGGKTPGRFLAGNQSWVVPVQGCGEEGWLCDMCKADRADARTDRLVEGLALAGLLIQTKTSADYKSGPCNSDLMYRASLLADMLNSEREGGEG